MHSGLLANGLRHRSLGHRPRDREGSEIGWPTANINPHILN
ncbi:hypothetical protein RISK_002251 [Rhodopirellula islandica]|uniref:Uncharacterized protein n=1 Tax=Rhodopirellula islandica TaxID=595434 RepID=A0A0J1EJB3_RHOIS|nr:hypothetical protein RISK_002251 [Rhodopirellula islandica]